MIRVPAHPSRRAEDPESAAGGSACTFDPSLLEADDLDGGEDAISNGDNDPAGLQAPAQQLPEEEQRHHEADEGRDLPLREPDQHGGFIQGPENGYPQIGDPHAQNEDADEADKRRNRKDADTDEAERDDRETDEEQASRGVTEPGEILVEDE